MINPDRSSRPSPDRRGAAFRRLRPFPLAIFGALTASLLVLMIAMVAPRDVGAHAFLDRSDPEANTVISSVPESVRLWFTEPLEEQYSAAALYDAEGERVDTPPSTVGPEDNLLTLPLPADLPNGTYTVQYRNVSAADGHPESGYVPFTVGGQVDVVVPTPPAQVDFGGPPAAVNALGRWLSLLGVAGVTGALVTWFWVVRPAFGTLASEHRTAVGRRVRVAALASVGVALVGSFIALSVQASTVGSALSISDTVNVITDSRFGTLWLFRVGLLVALGIFVYLPHGWLDNPRGIRWVGIGLAALVMLPFSLISHAAVPGAGRGARVISDWVHLGASSVWIGGLVTVLAGVIYALRRVPRESRREVYAGLIPRFSTMAIASVILLTLTGLYAAWLHVGNLVALQETSYGQTLAIKLALMVLMVILGAVNLLVIGPKMRQAASGATIHFGRTIAAEVVLGAALLFMVGLLTSLPTARETIAAESGRTVFHINQEGTHLSLYITPGAVGPNRYTADFSLPADELPEGTQVLLRTTPATDLGGVREVELERTEPTRFEASGTELSVVGNWDLEVILRRPSEADWRVTASTTLQTLPPEERTPRPAPRFPGMDGAAWILVLSGGLVVVIAAVRRQKSTGVAVFGSVLVVMSLVGLGFNREPVVPGYDKRNPIAMSQESIATGEALYVENCVDCHGPRGEGDGELLEGSPPNANLTLPHLFDHTEGELHWWISEGRSGTPMPGFSDMMSDEEIWHLVNYVYYLNASKNEE